MSGIGRPHTVGTELPGSEEGRILVGWRTKKAHTHLGIPRTQHRFREAVERKTRRKSFNNPENIENFGDKDNNTRLEELMKLHHLQKLMKEFSYFKPPDIVLQEATSYFPAKVQKRVPGAMNMVEFKEAFSRVLETHEYDEYLEKLFQKLDTTCDGYVDWSEFCTYMLLLYRENDYMRTKREIPFLVEPKIRHIVQNKQEQSTKVLASENPSRYVTVSKEGAITVWQNNMVMEKAYTISDDDAELNAPKRRFKMWVTDAIYLPNCNKLALASTSRDIRIFDCSTNQWFEEYNLFAMSDVPYCFDYWYDKKNPAGMSVLIFGVDAGAVHVLYFKKPLTQLFETAFKSEDGAQKIFWSEVEKGGHSRYVDHEKILHDKVQQIPPHLIRQVQYIHSKNSIISSTSSPNRSIVISDINKLKKQYVFNIEKGIECFDYNQNLNILVTGSLDHVIRLWNAYVASRPIAMLEGHATGVIGVKIHEGLMQVFSYSKDAVVKVWDIREHTCLQTVVLKFPSSIHGRMPEHGQFPMHLQLSPQDALIVTCNDYLGMLKLGQTHLPKQQSVTTHDTQLCSAIYNQLFKQVVTGCDSSNIAVWDLESGSKAIVFSNAHGEEEITCMVFDESWRRLITGARNGTIKVWNFQNGHNLHKLEAVGEAEVTGIVPVMDKNIILAVGWSRKIIVYDDSDADNLYVPANTDWKGGQLHADDILAMDFCLPQFLATGGFDGEITVWDLETEKIFVRLRRGQKPDITKKIESIQEQHSFLSSYSTMDMLEEAQGIKSSQTTSDPRPSSNTLLSRPNSRHRKSHRIEKGQPVPVDKLLFLQARCVGRTLEAAMLVSSEAGYLHWWCLFTAKHEMGYFYVPDTKDESVLAMCTNPSNSCLITGDTTGQIKIWDVSEYCLHVTERRVKTCPPLNVTFKAHDSAVVSVEYVKHDVGEFILTASTDKTARLWSMEGHYVGTFGQKKLWNLKNKKTWCHPKTPWDEMGTSKLDGNKTDNNSQADIAIETDTVQVEGQEDSSSKDNGEVEEEEEEVDEESVEAPTVQGLGDGGHNLNIKVRAQTIDLGSLRPERSKTFLGSKVARQLQSMKTCRMDRRNRLAEDVDFTITQRYGKLCSPFQALQTKDVVEVKLPSMPLSQRMINKGYTSDNMTEEMLRNMDFSYGNPDSPPSGDQDKKSTSVPKSDKTSTPASRRGPPRQISAIKKHNTVA
ncbi:WD repeat-containing protein on Y chromosome-like isoform X2 [Pecten maximus]|uniref:WD repeat-containing protein on Y chromosome-like isoform X2 n=1 Tax=Pecten maximus TaxID=6579 RepID=UPI001458C35D|nr:WD repeat-containing protein on Y chromosome-like isoform X2 [Pecten maximus]